MVTKHYIVHDAVATTVERPATLEDGTAVTAHVPALHAQLVPANGVGATIQLPILQPSAEESALLTEGTEIVVTFAAA